MLFICYPRCSTCKKARNWLDAHGVEYEYRDIQKDRPNKTELKRWHKQSGLPLRRFFNTSGRLYRELGVKDKLPAMSDVEVYELLATDGLLVKRPLLVGDDFVLVGFNEDAYKKAFGV